jgi:hypothetical protein
MKKSKREIENDNGNNGKEAKGGGKASKNKVAQKGYDRRGKAAAHFFYPRGSPNF